MTLRDICTSQETSRKLAEAGFPQEGLFYWVECFQMIEKETEKGVYEKKKIWFLEPTENINHSYHNYIRAFTFNELWELLPKKIETKNFTYYKHLNNDDVISYYCEAYNYIGDIDIGEDGEPGLILISFEIEQGENLSCAAAELALWCVKEKYLDVEESH
jgi:hypothetical protein